VNVAQNSQKMPLIQAVLNTRPARTFCMARHAFRGL